MIKLIKQALSPVGPDYADNNLELSDKCRDRFIGKGVFCR